MEYKYQCKTIHSYLAHFTNKSLSVVTLNIYLVRLAGTVCSNLTIAKSSRRTIIINSRVPHLVVIVQAFPGPGHKLNSPRDRYSNKIKRNTYLVTGAFNLGFQNATGEFTRPHKQINLKGSWSIKF